MRQTQQPKQTKYLGRKGKLLTGYRTQVRRAASQEGLDDSHSAAALYMNEFLFMNGLVT